MKKEQTLVEGTYYRVHPISKLVTTHPVKFESLPTSEGLAIEEKGKNNHYFVVAYVKFNNNREVYLEDVAFRTVKTIDSTKPDKMEEYKNCVEFAKKALKDLEEGTDGH